DPESVAATEVKTDRVGAAAGIWTNDRIPSTLSVQGGRWPLKKRGRMWPYSLSIRAVFDRLEFQCPPIGIGNSSASSMSFASCVVLIISVGVAARSSSGNLVSRGEILLAVSWNTLGRISKLQKRYADSSGLF